MATSVSRARLWRPGLFVVCVVALASIAGIVGCSAEDQPDALGENGGGPGGSWCVSNPTASGCACESEGATIACGTVERRSGDYVSCSHGNQTCVAGRWSDCIGDTVYTKTVPAHGTGTGTQNLGAAQKCTWNPCDPACTGYVDDTPGLNLPGDSGIVSNDAGLSLVVGTNLENPCQSFAITPADTTVTVTSFSPFTTSPATVTYTPQLYPTSCYSGTPVASWATSAPERVAIPNGQASVLSGIAGDVNVTAYVGTFQGSATLRVKVAATDNSAAPSGAVTKFASTPSGTDDAKILYPYYDTYFPLGLAPPLLQWSGTAASAVKVSLRYPTTGAASFEFSAIVAETSPGRYQIPAPVWAALEQTAKGNDISIILQRVVNNTLRPAITHRVHFTPAQLLGKIFYTEYNVASWTGLLRVINPAGTTPARNAFKQDPGACPVCHSVSANGRTLVTSDWGGAPSVVNSVDANGLLTRLSTAPSYPNGGDTRAFAYSAISSDGKYVLQGYNFWGNVANKPWKVYELNPTTGVPTDVTADSASNWGLGNSVFMVPSFSPDNKKLVVINGDTTGGAKSRQGVATFDFDAATKQFSNRRQIVNTATSVAATNLITRWPTFEPDSRSVVYQTNPANADESSYGGMGPSGYNVLQGKFWSADTSTPNSAVALDKLNTGLDASDSNRSYQPTFLPASSAGFRWTVFTSGRQYGNSLNLAGVGTRTTQLWVSALDDTTSATSDRSHPPFLLPNQVLGDNNSNRMLNERGYWVLDACKPPLPTVPGVPPWVWQSQDIGSASQGPGSVTNNDPSFSVNGAGCDIWGSNDGFRFVYKESTGDGQITARVDSLTATDGWAKIGIMVRQSLTDNSPHIIVATTKSNNTVIQLRRTAGAASEGPASTSGTAPRWLRLVRTGNNFQAYVSANGTTWSSFGAAQAITMTGTVYVGLAVTSHVCATTANAVFSNVSSTFARGAYDDGSSDSECSTTQECCGASATPATAECRIDLPVTNPVVRHCRATTGLLCSADGGPCSADTDCCQFPTSRCEATTGKCTPPPPVKVTPSATYWRDYTASCLPDQRIKWRFFDWIAQTPKDSNIVFEAVTAANVAGLTGTRVPLAVASGASTGTWTGVDVGAKLTAAGQVSLPNLRVYMTLNASTDRLASPLLQTWRQAYSCVDAE